MTNATTEYCDPCVKCGTTHNGGTSLPCPVCSEPVYYGTMLFDGVAYRRLRGGQWQRIGQSFHSEWPTVTDAATLERLEQTFQRLESSTTRET